VDIPRGGANDFEFQIAVAQEEPVASLDVFSQVRIVNGDLLPGTEDLARGQRERRAGFQHHRPRCDFTDPDFQSGEILEDGNGPPQALGDTPNSRDYLEVLGLRAMREVQPRDVHSGSNQLLQDFGRPRRGSNGAHDLRSGHRSSPDAARAHECLGILRSETQLDGGASGGATVGSAGDAASALGGTISIRKTPERQDVCDVLEGEVPHEP